MSFFVNTTYRTDEEEIMDDFTMAGPYLHNTLDILAKINKWLGGNKITMDGLKINLKNHDKKVPLTIIDLGCGNGDILRQVSDYGKENGYSLHLIGIDANPDAILYAKSLSEQYQNVTFKAMDIFSIEFRAIQYDLALTTLFLHHFKEDQLIKILSHLLSTAKKGVIVNDLQRSALAYYLFKALGVFIKNDMIKQDGLTSILRGFKRNELEKLSKQLDCMYLIRWKWAFRYQWLINKQ